MTTIMELESEDTVHLEPEVQVMFGPRFLMGAVVGGALVYFLDPEQGPGRRERARAWWEQNREPVMSTAASAASTAQARVSETSARVGEKVTEVGDRVSEKVTELQSKVRRDASRDDVPDPAPVQ
jgi:gas vesicle protein